MHCSPVSESLASSYVDGKNRQRVFAVLTVECRVDIFVSVRKKGPWVNRVRPDSLSALSLKGEFPIYIEYLSDRTDTVGCIWAATGSLIAGLHRHISILADSLSSSVGAYLCDPAFLFFIKSKNLRVSYSQFSEKDKGGKSDVTGISRRTK